MRTLPVGGTPTGIAASADAIWVAETAPGSTGAVSVVRIGPDFNTIGPPQRISQVVTGSPGEVAAQGDAVWVAPSSGLLTRLDPATGRVVQQVDPNAGPTGIDVADGAVWVTDSEANNVTRVDPTGLLTSIAVGNGPSGHRGRGGSGLGRGLTRRVGGPDRCGHSIGDDHYSRRTVTGRCRGRRGLGVGRQQR